LYLPFITKNIDPKASLLKIIFMKMIINVFTAIFLISILTSSSAFAQQTHVITLKVNTAEVEKGNTSATCSFENQAAGVTNEDFTIKAKVGDIIIWKGVSTNAPGTDRVDINAINHEGGTNVFNKNRLAGNGQEPEVVIGTVVQGAPGNVDKYKISFKVFNNGRKRNGTFHIDPKIQIH
jgi:hypothetical protein